MFHNYKFKNLDFKLIIAVIALTIIGIFVIGSANESNQQKQIIGMILGVIVMSVMALVDYDFILHFHWLFYGLVIALLSLVLLVGDKSGGATRWIEVGIRFQPSELGKILLILFFSWFLMMHEEDINKPKILAFTLLLSSVPLLLIEKEPDLSTTIVTMMIICVMMFVVGLSYKLVAIVLGISIPSIVILLILVSREGQTILKEYQGNRILAWLKPDKYPSSSYQQQNSIMAIGSGQLLGKGLGNDAFDSVKNGNYISEPHTDFIFAVAGEELGFLGSVLIIALIFFITIEILLIAKRAKDISGKLICVGMATLIGFQSFVNICVVTGLLPNTGLPLPFVSYGLTSLVTVYFGVGIVLNVGLQAKNINGRLF
ncbi:MULTISPECIES: FtsW/RodA/SpoVE family cell cycle protein [Pseudobutyrivibrio]|jgi:rod shape determining protein RodA|uniref:Rod shape-determining protein RodA n=1 Tax=Pseudobutyrivibrio xylanivorans TaxID=185007 RepID=A0A6M0LGY3_PSEXY|nr:MULTISPECIES: FtsW/RodA/SpoVE family cell cycle protein [Pseudobutyrivibrio]MBE5904007.1 rod shape-determining protein RodA [Pseudobutyrivibrio sp.]NEX01159.1 rod shape-determining protein RodA [Pseudobutyrivibrio xylanivorans]